MKIFLRFKNYIFNSFREFFVYHYSSLNFRAQIFALVIAADKNAKVENYIVVKEIAMEIYNNDEKRVDVLLLSTKEIVDKIKNSMYSMDALISKIQKELKNTPRYADKIDIEHLKPLLLLSHDEDTKHYQENILEFLQNIKDEILEKRKKRLKKKNRNKVPIQ